MNDSSPKWLKVDLHAHTAEDPQDRIGYTARALLDRAATLGYDALAVTNHNALTYDAALADYAAERGILLLPGTEITAEGCHVLVINPRFPIRPGHAYTLADIPRLKTPDSLWIAPHPFYFLFQSLHQRLYELLPYFDAVELASYHNSVLDLNNKALRAAAEAGKPVIGTSDCHTLWQFGKTYSLVQAEKNMASIIAAVKAGRIRVRTSPISVWTMVRIIFRFFTVDKFWKLFRRLSRDRLAPPRTGDS
jgi:predicted metal-dependent phosphoesterase TrpH